MSITLRGTLRDKIESFFSGEGDPINIDGIDYTLREYGGLPKQDPMRLSVLSDLETRARTNPKKRIIYRYETEPDDSNQEIKEKDLALKVTFTKVEETAKKDASVYQYLLVKGTNYKIEVENRGEFPEMEIYKIIQNGRSLIHSYEQENGKLPDSLKFGYGFEKKIGSFRFKTKHWSPSSGMYFGWFVD